MKPQDRIRHLERERSRLERLLALALPIAVHGTEVKPLELLAVLEELDRKSQTLDPERLALLLGEPA